MCKAERKLLKKKKWLWIVQNMRKFVYFIWNWNRALVLCIKKVWNLMDVGRKSDSLNNQHAHTHKHIGRSKKCDKRSGRRHKCVCHCVNVCWYWFWITLFLSTTNNNIEMHENRFLFILTKIKKYTKKTSHQIYCKIKSGKWTFYLHTKQENIHMFFSSSSFRCYFF